MGGTFFYFRAGLVVLGVVVLAGSTWASGSGREPNPPPHRSRLSRPHGHHRFDLPSVCLGVHPR
jgi:hypothetical protein